MQIIEKNNNIAIAEQEELRHKIKEEEERKAYIKGINKSPDFQKWIVEGIIKKRINELNNLDGIDIKSLDFEKLGKMTMVNKLVKLEVESMFEEFL